jgi:hypothetical protein
MELTATLVSADNGHSTLEGHAEVIVNGQFAQFGGRMMTSVSDMILLQFADVFSQKAAVQQASMAPVDAAPAADAGGAAGDGSGATGAASSSAAAAASTTPPAARAVPAAPIVAKEFNALAFAWLMFKNFFAGLFGRKS